MTRPIVVAGILTFIALQSPSPAPAELLYFKAGGRVHAPATVRDGHVLVEMPSGSFRFRETEFVKIVPGFCPAKEWPARREAALGGDARARLSAAWWALENGLVPECVAMLRSARESEPKDPQAACLGALLDRLEMPCTDGDTDRLRQALSGQFNEARSRHVLLLHQHEPADVEARLDLLEHVVVAYYLLFAFHGIDLEVPGERLTSVYLRDRASYVRFLESQNAGAFRTTFGYFHPTFRSVVAYDVRTAGQRPRPERSDDNDRKRLLRESATLAVDLGTAAHEMVHMLVVESGLDTHPRRFPVWLHEGLAAQFEVVRGGRWAGIGRAHDLRLPDWRRMTPPPALEALVLDRGLGRGYQSDLYAGSWALVYHLRKTRPSAFFSFIDLIRIPANPEPPAGNDRALTVFRRVYGADLQAAESAWRRTLGEARTPLEENAPDGSESEHFSQPGG